MTGDGNVVKVCESGGTHDHADFLDCEENADEENFMSRQGMRGRPSRTDTVPDKEEFAELARSLSPSGAKRADDQAKVHLDASLLRMGLVSCHMEMRGYEEELQDAKNEVLGARECITEALIGESEGRQAAEVFAGECRNMRSEMDELFALCERVREQNESLIQSRNHHESVAQNSTPEGGT